MQRSCRRRDNRSRSANSRDPICHLAPLFSAPRGRKSVAPTCISGMADWRAFPIRLFPATCPPECSNRSEARFGVSTARSCRKAIAPYSSTYTGPAGVPGVHGSPHADALSGQACLRNHGFGVRGSVRRLVAIHLPRARRRRCAPSRRSHRRRLHRRRLRPPDRRSTSANGPGFVPATASSSRASAPLVCARSRSADWPGLPPYLPWAIPRLDWPSRGRWAPTRCLRSTRRPRRNGCRRFASVPTERASMS